MKWPFVFLVLATALCGAAEKTDKPGAGKKAKAETFLDVASAGQDYKDQGEYTNSWGGAQVIALGDDNFRMVTYQGGLPGAGWNKESRTEVPGKRDGDKIVFTGENEYRAELTGGSLVIKSSNGGPWKMEKVERKSPTLGAKPPKGSVILFEGANAEGWVEGKMDERHLLAAGTRSHQSFTNFTLHLEFLLPFKPLGRGQDRGNSGVYLQDRYECQVLDSFGLTGADNECGGFYKQARPAVNMCFPPLVWQTYDIDFTAAKYDDKGTKTKNAFVTVNHNGVTIHDNFELKGPTAGNAKGEDPTGGPFYLQGHGNPVYYQNIWVMPK